jgi:tetratricopeptide (TPR) repeat protein
MSNQIERAISDENWTEARRLIQAELVKTPDSHWLITRLGLTYYEERRYEEALELATQALALAPECPLALWDYAGALEMLGRPAEALAVYQRLVERGVDAVAHGDCGEGRAWARGLIADCHYRMSGCWRALGNSEQAERELSLHLNLRGPGCRSIYPLRSLRRAREKQRGPA